MCRKGTARAMPLMLLLHGAGARPEDLLPLHHSIRREARVYSTGAEIPFSHVGCSPDPEPWKTPAVFISHGHADRILPIAMCGRRLAHQLPPGVEHRAAAKALCRRSHGQTGAVQC